MKRFFAIGLAILVFPSRIFAMDFVGHITQSGTNNPAAQALVVFVAADGKEKARTVTGDDGLCFIRDVPEGTYRVRILYHGKNTEHPNVVVSAATRQVDLETPP